SVALGHTRRVWGMTRILRLALVASMAGAAALGPGAATAHAASAVCDTSWKKAADGDWNVAANWTHGVPDDNHACITHPGTYTVPIAGSGGLASSLVLGDRSSAPTLDLEATCRPAGGGVDLSLDGDSAIGPHATLEMTYSQCDDFVQVDADFTTI